jgi:hypothetical protein
MHISSIRTVWSALLFALVMCSMAAASFAQVSAVITVGPPPLPVYEQPICPGDGYLWTPGYWAYDNDISDYYWVPGTWVLAPEVGFLWTPPYWGWGGDGFVFYDGYWGPTIGFYGGINYGFGYFGIGFGGGRWDNGQFFYNSAVMNVNVTTIHNVYSTTVVNNNVSHVSYNGGNGGVVASPTPQEQAAARERHIPPVAAQVEHTQAARANPQERASANKGKPGVAVTPRPGDFNDRAAAPARDAGAAYIPANHPANPGRPASADRPNTDRSSADRPNNDRSSSAVHPHDLPAMDRTMAPSTGNAKRDRKYQQQLDKQAAKQQEERDKLQQKQDEEHVQLDKQRADDPTRQQLEQQHQQQTQQLQQKHDQERQELQQKQQPPNREAGNR